MVAGSPLGVRPGGRWSRRGTDSGVNRNRWPVDQCATAPTPVRNRAAHHIRDVTVCPPRSPKPEEAQSPQPEEAHSPRLDSPQAGGHTRDPPRHRARRGRSCTGRTPNPSGPETEPPGQDRVSGAPPAAPAGLRFPGGRRRRGRSWPRPSRPGRRRSSRVRWDRGRAARRVDPARPRRTGRPPPRPRPPLPPPGGRDHRSRLWQQVRPAADRVSYDQEW